MSQHESQANSNQPQSAAEAVTRWEQLRLEIYQSSTSFSLNQLVCYLDYAVNGGELSPQQALQVLEGERSLLLNIQSENDRDGALAAFGEYTSLNQTEESQQLCFCGSRYDFCLTYTPTWLEIKATYRHNGQSSGINTLNYILGAFDIDLDSSNAEDSDWSGSREQVQAWVETARSLFEDELFLQALERELDQDRREGEWEAA
jgi:hypothetical protein